MIQRNKILIQKTSVYIILFTITLFIMFPIVWLFLNSLKTYKDIYAYPIVYWPKQFTLEHYKAIGQLNFSQYIFNSVIISSGAMLGSLLIGILPAYAFARYTFRGKVTLQIVVLIMQMFPMIIFLPPIFALWRDLHLLNTRIGLIVAYIPFLTPVVIIFLQGFFSSITTHLEEAACIDGCNFIQSFIFVVLPVSLPGIASISIYGFLFAWSELLFAMQILVDKPIQNIPAFLSAFVGEYQTRWGELFAGSFLAMLPPLIIFLFFQKGLVTGLTAGATKG